MGAKLLSVDWMGPTNQPAVCCVYCRGVNGLVYDPVLDRFYHRHGCGRTDRERLARG